MSSVNRIRPGAGCVCVCKFCKLVRKGGLFSNALGLISTSGKKRLFYILISYYVHIKINF